MGSSFPHNLSQALVPIFSLGLLFLGFLLCVFCLFHHTEMDHWVYNFLVECKDTVVESVRP